MDIICMCNSHDYDLSVYIYEIDVLSFIVLLSKPENNPFGKNYSAHHKSSSYSLKNLSLFWLLIASLLGFVNLLLGLVLIGPDGLIKEILPTANHSAAYAIVPYFVITMQVVTPLPLVIVRVSSYYTEHRILGMIEYVESVHNTQQNYFSIELLMDWYDDLYQQNRLLSKCVNLYVTSAIIIRLPQCIFLLQVSKYVSLKIFA
jgi:hypothetical protein